MTFSNYNVLHLCTDIHSSVTYLVWNPSPLLRYGVSTRNKAWSLLFWSVNDFKAAPCWFVQGSHEDLFGWNFCFVAFKIQTEQILVWSFYFSTQQSVFIEDRQMTFNFSDCSFSEIFSSLHSASLCDTTETSFDLDIIQVKGWGSQPPFRPFRAVHTLCPAESFFQIGTAMLSNCRRPLFSPQLSASLLPCPCLLRSTLPS